MTKPYRPRVLIFGEYSGRMRDAFIANGCDAMSVDFHETERPGPHHVGDGVPLLSQQWDAMIAHPECTYLTNAGVRWLYKDGRRYNEDGTENQIDPVRWKQMRAGADFFRMLLNQDRIPLIAVENPVMHGHGVRSVGRNFDFSFQPWEHGEPFKKRTCFWLKGLTPFGPTKIVPEHLRVAEVHLASPGPDRWKDRSRTYQGVADAAAAHWAEEIKSYCAARRTAA